MVFQRDNTFERSLFSFSYRDLVEDDSDVWLYIDLFDSLSYGAFESAYKGEGQVQKNISIPV